MKPVDLVGDTQYLPNTQLASQLARYSDSTWQRLVATLPKSEAYP
jgi:hypothetical protein